MLNRTGCSQVHRKRGARHHRGSDASSGVACLLRNHYPHGYTYEIIQVQDAREIDM